MDATEDEKTARANAEALAMEQAGGKPAKAGKTTKRAKAAEEGLIAVTVIGPANGRRRAGFDFGKAAVTVDVTEDQLKAIEADPMLSVQPAI